jgi:hypothetical protein
MSPSRQAIRTLIARSPDRVAVHDRDGWLALFSDEAFIEDPVGSAPAPKANGVLGKFYDTFIAPHDIRFEVRADYFLGNDVFRDVNIHTVVRPGVEVDVAAYLLYQVDGTDDDALHVRRMAAHWTLATMTKVAMVMGPRAWWAMTGLFARMIRIMGLGWVGVYLASLWRGIGSRGTRALGELVQAIAARDANAVSALFVLGGDTPANEIELGEKAVSPGALFDELPVGVLLEVESPVAAGWTTTFRYRLAGPAPAHGIGILQFDPATHKIARARFFAADPA